MDRNAGTLELHDQENRRLTFLNPMCDILEGRETLGKRRKTFSEIDQELDPILSVGFPQFRDDLIEFGQHGAASLFDEAVVQDPLAIGTRTRLPHSVHDPS